MDRSTDLFQIIWIPNWYLSFHFHAWSQRTDKRIPEKKAFLWSVQLLYKTFNSFLNMKMIYVWLDMLDEIVLLQNKRCLTCTLSQTWILLYIPIFWYNRCILSICAYNIVYDIRQTFSETLVDVFLFFLFITVLSNSNFTEQIENTKYWKKWENR